MALENNQIENSNIDNDEISLKELIIKIKEWGSFLKTKQKTIFIAGIIGALIGLTIPDPNLKLDEASGHYIFGEINWNEFYEVVKGNGPCNKERINARRKAKENGLWVREAAMAFSAKRAIKKSA